MSKSKNSLIYACLRSSEHCNYIASRTLSWKSHTSLDRMRVTDRDLGFIFAAEAATFSNTWTSFLALLTTLRSPNLSIGLFVMSIDVLRATAAKVRVMVSVAVKSLGFLDREYGISNQHRRSAGAITVHLACSDRLALEMMSWEFDSGKPWCERPVSDCGNISLHCCCRRDYGV